MESKTNNEREELKNEIRFQKNYEFCFSICYAFQFTRNGKCCECKCGDWDGYGEHTFTKGFCTVCGAADPTYIPSVSDSNAIYGDVNGDGKITVDDVTLIQKSAVFLVTFDKNKSILTDVNNDGLINVLDVTLIQKYIVKLNYNTELVGKPVKTN